MSERCPKCRRKKLAAAKATNPDLCHRLGSHDCLAAERGYVRGIRDASVHLRAVINDVAYDSDENTIDSMGISVVANGLRFLAAHGRVRIELDHGADVVGRWA